mgnify:FL=1
MPAQKLRAMNVSNLILLLSVLLLQACDQGSEPIQVDLDKRVDIKAERELESLTYAYLPQYSHKTSYIRHHPIVEYLYQTTGIPIRQVFPDTFAEHVQMVGRDEIDISFSNPLVYIQIAERHQARAFGRIVEKGGRTDFRGQIICRADNKAIQSLQDCRRKSWIAVSPSSAAGYLFALDHFARNGIHKGDFREIAFAPGAGGKQEKVVLSVYLGEYDIGSIREGTLPLVQDQLDLTEIRVLDQTRWYPGWVYAARQGLNPDHLQAIKQALLALNQEHQDILEKAHFTGVVPARDSDFDPIRELASNVGVTWREDQTVSLAQGQF